jgi:predicted PhzF superfamily epimerase YddE/YHI9
MRLRMFRVDAFTDQVFHGNPAAVIPLRQWLDDDLLQKIAAENYFSETAFFIPIQSGFHLRWFTPVAEVPLCGHATLATAFVIFNFLTPTKKLIHFHTLGGDLHVSRKGDLLMLDFPRYVLQRCDAPALLTEGLGLPPKEVWNTREDKNYYAIFETAREIRSMAPKMNILEKLHPYQVAVTAPDDTVDFVSRFFAPSIGIPEDPVTGSMHCALIPYWANRLGKTILQARQVSSRGGDLYCEDHPAEGRVRISGRAVLSLRGYIPI